MRFDGSLAALREVAGDCEYILYESPTGESWILPGESRVLESQYMRRMIACRLGNAESWKFGFEAVTRYSPTGKSRTKYRPKALVVVVRVAPVSLFFTLTVAPWITALEESVTIPVMLPDVCAWAVGIASDARIRNDARIGRRRRS